MEPLPYHERHLRVQTQKRHFGVDDRMSLKIYVWGERLASPAAPTATSQESGISLLAAMATFAINASASSAPNQTQRISPQPPLPEAPLPLIEAAFTEYEVLVLPRGSTVPEKRVVDVVKSQNPSQAYARIHAKAEKNLDHHAPGWGCVFFGYCLKARSDGVFEEPSPTSVEYVAIKRLTKEVVDACLEQGKKEDPYKEIERMQTLGDNIHVLGCVEALQDERYLYIIMPLCEQESLVEWIPWRNGVAEPHARAIFRQILENVLYLRSHGICHRDLSPDNCMVYKGRVVFTDLAMSFKIPPSGFVTPLGGFGKPAYLPPEVFFNLPFDAEACDIWSAAVILFNLLTGEILYETPDPGNLMFRYFILARGVSRTPVNERTLEILMDLEETEKTSLWNVAQKCLALSPKVVDLLDGILKVAANQRWTTDQVASCGWVLEGV